MTSNKIKGTTVLAPAEPYISPDGTPHTELVVECKYCDRAYTARESSLRSGWTYCCGCIYGILNHMDVRCPLRMPEEKPR